eukprot:454479_1
MGIYDDCKKVMADKPGSTLTALEREVLYARIRAFSVRVQYIIWNIAATVLLYLFNGSLLNGYISNGYYYKIIIFHSIQIISIISYFCTSLVNPGYIELNENEHAIFGAVDGKFDSDKSESDNINYENIAEWNKNILIDANNAPFNFCWRCKFIRPIRSKHCYDCDRCIARFDHHCPMVGNCVGGKNHRYFLIFLFSQSIIIVWSFQLSIIDLYNKYHNIISHHNSNDSNDKIHLNLGLVFRLLFFISMFFAMFIVIGLCGFHCYLSSTNQTTYEMVKPHILEKWVKEENKRKKKYNSKLRKNVDNQYQYEAVNIDDIDNDYIDDEIGIEETYYRSEKDNNMISFDEGYLKNIYAFWTATLKKDWIIPLSCVLKDSDDDVSH